MIIKEVIIEKFRAFKNVSFKLGKHITVISGRNATQKTTLLGMIGQPFTISKNHPMHGCKTIDGYNFKSQFKEKFKISEEHDIIGQHKWTLKLYKNISESDEYIIESIARKSPGKHPQLRFWNAKGRTKGSGYIQRPVYFLSLSRLFPIGETGKTKNISPSLSKSEIQYCIDNYQKILSIQNLKGNASISLEKGTRSKTFTGINDDIHDVFANSAGEGNITKIILSILSFKSLKEKYSKDYKGGILLIDELDATLYGFSQKQLVNYLLESAKYYQIQIVFTTHSPIILKQVYNNLRKERQIKGDQLPVDAYDSSIVYLNPEYDDKGNREIKPENITTVNRLNEIFNDIDLRSEINKNKIHIYCEDKRAILFVKFILSGKTNLNIDAYMEFIDINLGWTNYTQLFQKQVPEFVNNIIILDADVPETDECKNNEKIKSTVSKFLLLPLVIERDLFIELKDHASFNIFHDNYSKTASFNYDICFNEWPLDASRYKTNDLKKWYTHLINSINSEEILFSFWIDQHQTESNQFVNNFIKKFNYLADKRELDRIPIIKQYPKYMSMSPNILDKS